MCHSGWFRRMYEEREESRKLWDEFEHTRPLNDPEPTEEEAEVTLEHRDVKPVAANR
jgi:hypothetical protein